MKSRYAIAVACILCAPQVMAQQAGTAQFEQPSSTSCSNCLSVPPSSIILDASAGKLAFPLPAAQRNFATASDFAAFLQQNLNATPVYDGSGNVIGATGSILQIGSTYYVDGNNVVQPITEPISAFIGGLSAQFTVAGVTYTTGVQGQDYLVPQRTASAPADVYQCNQHGECVSGHSWNTHSIGKVYNSVGIEVDQETGGYQESHYFCFAIPPICTSSSGSNQLHLDGALWFSALGPSQAYNNTAANVTHLEFNDWSVCFLGSCGDAGSLVGACEQHSSAAIPSVGKTIAGTTGQCPGPLGVTCSAGYTLCQPNNECTSLTNDDQNCGACNNVCPTGYKCQNTSCVPCSQASACDAAGAFCGSVQDSCGQTWNCGTCDSPLRCISGACECPAGMTCSL